VRRLSTLCDEKRPELMSNGLTLAHETPGRLRFRLPLLRRQEIDFSWLQTRLDGISGVTHARINPQASSIILEYNGDKANRQTIFDLLATFDLQTLSEGEGSPESLAELTPMIMTGGLMASMPLMNPKVRGLLTWLNISPALLKGANALLTRGIKMEVLDGIAVGLTAYKGEYLTSNITTFLTQLGEYLETLTEQQSDSLLKQLLRPETASAWVERKGKLVQIPGDQVETGEQVAVGVGERIPVDGLVLDGTALVNQSSITGEDVPVRKEVMDQAIAGTVIEEGRLRIEARQVGEDTTTARIAQYIESSLGQHSETQRLAEIQADKRVYLTLGTGALIYMLTQDTGRLESIFLVDYSCALKLGTPVAFKSGIYNAASAGILLKGGMAIENLAGVDAIVFDKTGTLTYNELQVTDVEVLDKKTWPKERLLAVTASIEEHASHPIAEAIVNKAKEEKLNHIDHGEVDYIVAHGMNCPVNGDHLLIGSRHYLEEHEKIDFTRMEDKIVALEKQGKTLLFVATSKQPIGIIALQTTVRKEAAAVINQLRARGVKHVVMLTGDRRSKAEAMATELGIDEVFAEKAPEEKADVIAELQSRGYKVAFVGDGVNDGPALVAANAGIAMPRGAELARATADIVLLEDRLDLLVDALTIAQKTMQLIQTNFKLAIGINTAVLFGAALGKLSPVATSLLHNGTTVGLLLNALRGANTD